MSVKKKFYNIFDDVKQHFDEANYRAKIVNSIKTAIKVVLQKFTGSEDPFESMKHATEAFEGRLEKMKDGISDFLGGAVEGVVDAIDDTTDAILDGAKKTAKGMLGESNKQFAVIVDAVHSVAVNLDEKLINKLESGLNRFAENSIEVVFKKVNGFGKKIITKIFKDVDETGESQIKIKVAEIDASGNEVKADIVDLSKAPGLTVKAAIVAENVNELDANMQDALELVGDSELVLEDVAA